MSTLNTEAAAERAAAGRLLPMIWGIHISRCIYAVAELGIADLLAEGTQSSQQLAAATGTHEPSLYRVLRALAALDVFEEHEAHHFSLTLMGERLRTGANLGMRAWTVFPDVRPFEHILETIRTGASGRQIEYGVDTFQYLADHPEAAARFDEAMAERTAAYAPSVADTFDFSEVGTVIDLGGGNGTLLVEILRRHQHLSGVLFELPSVAARATAIVAAGAVTERCRVIAGDFFQSVPPAGCYLLANVLHDWNDTRSIDILRNCREAMPGHGRVLIIERLIPEDGSDPVPALLSDINMLVFTGGQERTNSEYGALLHAAGLRLTRVIPVASPYGIIESMVT
jgi:hypothetical protein